MEQLNEAAAVRLTLKNQGRTHMSLQDSVNTIDSVVASVQLNRQNREAIEGAWVEILTALNARMVPPAPPTTPTTPPTPRATRRRAKKAVKKHG